MGVVKGKVCKRGHDDGTGHSLRRERTRNCIACIAERPRSERQRAREHERNTSPEGRARNRRIGWRRHYGITEDQVRALHEAQEGRCAICGRPDADSSGRALHVDHDHVTGQLRGLLCGNCNHGLGKFGDDPDRIRRAAIYLDTARARRVE